MLNGKFLISNHTSELSGDKVIVLAIKGHSLDLDLGLTSKLVLFV